jgi:hypothetical protein
MNTTLQTMHTTSYMPRARASALGLICALFLASCGGDQLAVAPGGGGTGSTIDNGIFVVVGPITKVSPLTVNGIEFSPVASTIIIENGDNVNGGLHVGMVARIDGRTSPNSSVVQARTVIVGAELRAPISEINLSTQTFKSQGVLIEVDASTQFDGVANRLASLSASDYVQVHGYPSGDNRILATLIAKRAVASEVKFIATIDQGVCTQCRPGERDFLAAGNVIQVAASAAVSPLATLPGGLVKIVGERTANNVIVAREVSPYTIAEPPLDGSRITIQGLVSSAQSGSDFKVTGLPIQTTANTQVIDSLRFGATLSAGNLLEVEGQQIGGVVKATRVVRR